jgi:hypothetical protein
LPRRSYTGGPTLLAVGTLIGFLCISTMGTSAAHATDGLRAGSALSGSAGHATAASGTTTALGGFVKDRTLASILGETLFRDTVDVMSDPSVSPPTAAPTSGVADPTRDNSAVGQVARTVLAHRTLDKYLWLIQRAYDDSLWKGGDRARIEQHFPLIWRTSIMLYESTLNASPNRVRVCTPTENADEFDCRDEVERAKIVPIPAQAPLLGLLHQPAIG